MKALEPYVLQVCSAEWEEGGTYRCRAPPIVTVALWPNPATPPLAQKKLERHFQGFSKEADKEAVLYRHT